MSARSDAALAVQIARELLQEGRMEQADAALRLAAQKCVVPAIEAARELIRRRQYQAAYVALNIAFEQLRVPAGELSSRLERVHGHCAPSVRDEFHSVFTEAQLLASEGSIQ